MKQFLGKTAFITGGASGMGFGMARTFAAAGMNIVIADVREQQLAQAAAHLAAQGTQVLPLQLDVTDRKAYARAADAVQDKFGNLHVLCNNAGIGLLGSLRTAKYDDWDWVLGVNLGGVVNGIQTFLPRMLAHGEEGHIVTTASAAGLIGGFNAGIYTTSKMAIVGMMECLRGDLAGANIGVSVLCPHLVRTDIHRYDSLRPDQFKDSGYKAESAAASSDPAIEAMVSVGMDPLDVGRRVLRGIERNDLYILTHPEIEGIIRERFEAILAALPDEPADPERVKVEAPTLHYPVYTEHKAAR